MKKKHISLLFLFAALLSLPACNDFLDIQPIGKVMPQTATEYRALLTEAYSSVPADRGMSTFRSDELTMEGEQNATNLDSYLDVWRWYDVSPDETTLSFSWRTYY